MNDEGKVTHTVKILGSKYRPTFVPFISFFDTQKKHLSGVYLTAMSGWTEQNIMLPHIWAI